MYIFTNDINVYMGRYLNDLVQSIKLPTTT